MAAAPEAERSARVKVFRREWGEVNATDAARELLDHVILKPAVGAIDQQFKDQPLVDAQLRQVLADRYRTLDLHAAAMPLQESALATRRRLAEAEPYMREAVEKARRVLGEDSPSTLIGIRNLGALLQKLGRLAEAEPFLRQALEIRRRLQGEEHPDTLQAVNGLGALLVAEGKLAEAEALLLQGAAIAGADLEPSDKVRGELSQTIAGLYETWEEADPGKGYAAKAAEWRAKSAEHDAAASSGKP